MGISDKELFSLFKSFTNSGSVWHMAGLDKTRPDYKALITIACAFAKEGHEVRVLAPVHYKDPLYHHVYGALIGTMYYRKCPDLMIDNCFVEYESYKRPFKSRKISHMIKRGSEQSDRIIIDNNKGASYRFIVNMVINRLKDKSFQHNIEELYVYERGSITRLYKKAVGSVTPPAARIRRIA